MSDLIPIYAPWSGRVLTIAVFTIGFAVAAWALWRRRTSRPTCPICRYDLSATPAGAPCPECGRVTTPAARLRSRRRWRLAIISLLVATSLPTHVAQRRIRRFGWDYYLRLYPLYAIWPLQTIKRIELDDVTIIVRRSRRLDAQTVLVVRHRARTLGRLHGFRYRICEPGDAELGLSEDVNGDGAADVIIETNSFGAHCCATLTLLSMADGAAWLTPVVSMVDANPEFVDLDQDGVYEVITGDDVFLYWKTAYTASPQPRIVLGWDGSAYELGHRHMRRPAPSAEELQTQAQAYVEPAEYETSVWYSPLFPRVVDLIYSANAASAIELAHLAWQPRWSGSADDFLAAIGAQLTESPHFDDLQRTNPAIDLASMTPR